MNREKAATSAAELKPTGFFKGRPLPTASQIGEQICPLACRHHTGGLRISPSFNSAPHLCNFLEMYGRMGFVCLQIVRFSPCLLFRPTSGDKMKKTQPLIAAISGILAMVVPAPAPAQLNQVN
jgi:hypothetical protein